MAESNIKLIIDKHKDLFLNLFDWVEHPSLSANFSDWSVFAVYVNDFLNKYSLEKTAENYLEQIDKEFESLKTWISETQFPDYCIKTKSNKLISFKDYIGDFLKDYLTEYRKLYKKMVDENLPELPKGKDFPVNKLYKSDGSEFNFAECHKSVLKAIYLLENSSDKPVSFDQFYLDIISALRERFSSTFAKTDHTLPAISLSNEEKAQIENDRQNYLTVLNSYLDIDNDDYIHFKFLCEHIASASPEEIKQLIDKLSENRKIQREYYEQVIKEIEGKLAEIEATATTSLYEIPEAVRLSKELELNKQYLSVIMSDYEWILPIYYVATFGDGDNFLTQKIHHSFTKNLHDPENDYNKILLYLINMRELDRVGLVEKGFTLKQSGYMYKDGKPTTIDSEFKDLSIIRHLHEIDFDHQINAVCNINIKEEKKVHKTKVYEETEEKTELSARGTSERYKYTREVYTSNPIISSMATGPVYVKFTRENLTRGTIEIALFKYLTDDIEAGIQIVRAEELYSLWRPDRTIADPTERIAATHSLYGSETVPSTRHFHIYSQEEALWRKVKKLGYMDPSHIVLSQTMSHKELDRLFNNCCGINNNLYNKVYNNQPS